MKTKNLISRYIIGALSMAWLSQYVQAQAPVISYPGPQTYTAGASITPITPTNTGGALMVNGQTSTLAGHGTAGFINGTGTSAYFNEPIGVITDPAGNIYVADYGNNAIRKITPAGVVTTFAGTGAIGSANGAGASATFYQPIGLAIDGAGNIYVADRYNNMIRKITPAGVVSTLAGNGTVGLVNGPGASAEFYQPGGVALDGGGNVYVADYLNCVIRKITPAGVVSTFAGTGTAGYLDGPIATAKFNGPQSLAFDRYGNLIVADKYNNMVRMISPGGMVSTVAGQLTAGHFDGSGTAAMFNNPFSVNTDASGNIYVADYGNNDIRVISSAGVVSTLSGAGSVGSANGGGMSAQFNGPAGVAIDAAGNLYVGDYNNHLIRKVATTLFTATQPLPAGLSLNTTTGVISGAPVTTSSATAYSITAYNIYGTGTASVTITVNAAPAGIQGQSLNQNYVLSNTPRISGMTTDSILALNVSNKASVQTSIQYVDGLGRPVQTVQQGASPLGYDMVSMQAYDQYGRESTKYLPYAPQTGTLGSYRPSAVSEDQNAFYAAPPSNSGVSVIADPYAQTAFESSPLSRPMEQGAPGVPWQPNISGVSGSGHTVKMVYTVNNATTFASDSVNSRQVAMYYCTINSDLSRTLHANGYYAAGTLTVTISKDENWVSGRAGTVEEYKDIDGEVVLKRVYNYSGTTLQQLSTYYVYDDLGKLAFVLPPASAADGAGAISQAALNNLCYQYQYDERGRPIEKKIPGKGWEYSVYNVMDQPVATQDSLQRAAKNWVFTKYDALGRPVLTGIWNNGGTAVSRASLQTTLTAITTNLYEATVNTGNGYTNVAWPTVNVTATLTTNYYDGYANIPGLPATYTLTSGVSLRTRSLPTVKKTAVLNTPTDQLWDMIYYDELGRATTTYAQHYLGGTANTNNYDVSTTTYNFTNAPTTVTRKHWNTASTTYPLVTIFNKYIYDQVGRKLKTWEQITNGNNGPDTSRVISRLNYNEVGQIKNKQLHSKDSLNYLQTIAYTYNERGWLAGSAAPLFSMQLQFNTGTNKAYNGNIMYQFWTTQGMATNHYTYTYDKLNRLMVGGDALGNTENMLYDVMGNLTSIYRSKASTLIDQLAYTYTGNQLASITDATTNDLGLKHGTWSYTYDGNGNLLTDPSKGTSGISIAYNILNLPQSITGSKTITYTYDAAGNKLRRVSPNTGNTDYISGIQYDGTTTSTLSFIQTEEGKAVPNGTSYDYTYYLGDNLGNTRVTFGTKTGAAVLYQSDDYYPFGMEISNSVTSPKNEYLYNKKELQEELAEYDYGARFYDPVSGRWNTIDPLASKYFNYSPYNYAANNPIVLIDPDGRDVSIDSWGTVTFNNVGHKDAVAAGYILQGKSGNVYLDIEGNKNTRNRINGLNNTGYYGHWSFISAKDFATGANAIKALTDARGAKLDNLAVETHGSEQNESQVKINDVASTDYTNFIYNSDLDKVNGNVASGNVGNCDEIEGKVNQLKSLLNLVKNGGNFILAACDIGKGEVGKAFGENIETLAGNRLNVFLPKAFVDAGVGNDPKTGRFIPSMDNTFNVQQNAGWLKVSPNGDISNVGSIKMNLSEGPPIQIVK